MKHKSIRIADIQTTEILFFDNSIEELCLEFCDERNIDCLPSLEDPQMVHVRASKDKRFEVSGVGENRTINHSENIFSPNVLEQFRDNHLLLVYENSDLVGVVHFSDYNKPVVMKYLYSELTSYEKTLRKYLLAQGFENKDIINYFQDKKKKAKTKEQREPYEKRINAYKRKETEIKELPPFQSFYLSDLISFLNHKDSKLNHGDVVDLRNMIMHARDLINLQDWNAGNFIYRFESFERFFKSVRALLMDQRKIENRIAFLAKQ